ncbi:Ankyrin repeat domain containing protein, partial [Asbolus verrucosus]
MNGHLDVSKALINNKAKINVNDKLGLTPLHLAAANGHLEVVKMLNRIEYKVNVNMKTIKGISPLQHATGMEDLELTKLLLENGADPNLKNNEGYAILHIIASRGDNLKMFKLLVQHGALVNISGKKGETPLHVAAGRGKTGIAKFLIENGAIVNAEDHYGLTPLYHAQGQHHEEMYH